MILNLNRGNLIYWDTVWSTCTPSYAKEQGTCPSSTGDKLSSGDDQDPCDTVLTQNKEDTLSLKLSIFTQRDKSHTSCEHLSLSKEGSQAQGPFSFRPQGTDWKMVHMRLPFPMFSSSLKPDMIGSVCTSLDAGTDCGPWSNEIHEVNFAKTLLLDGLI